TGLGQEPLVRGICRNGGLGFGLGCFYACCCSGAPSVRKARLFTTRNAARLTIRLPRRANYSELIADSLNTSGWCWAAFQAWISTETRRAIQRCSCSLSHSNYAHFFCLRTFDKSNYQVPNLTLKHFRIRNDLRSVQ